MRKGNNDRYPENTAGLQSYLESKGKIYNLFSDNLFKNVQDCLDTGMKSSAQNGIGLVRKQASSITREMENILG